MSRIIYDILPSKHRTRAKRFWKRNSGRFGKLTAGRIKVGSLVLFLVATILATGYFYALSSLP